ncbi:calpain-10 isoform X1 [Amia ocellicauda]|uniref:calpain-10 isoform X1 n=1 Tax=Amia ocellicauda TaxID=2972642 RepID=UPI0034640241
MECGDQQGALFEDPDFPPEQSSLFSDCMSPIAQFRGEMTWMRPQDICQSPKLFPENPQEAHAKQGILGDCWFLCACTMLLKNQHLLDKVVPPGQLQWDDPFYAGRFTFCFWQCGRWEEVQIDDLLPCIGAKPCFSHCRSPSAFWVALLEKAYAKLHGSYERLWAGQVAEAQVDVTGGLAERWTCKVGPKEECREGADAAIWKKLELSSLVGVRDRCVMSCSVHSSKPGASELGQFHAYSVMEWVDVKSLKEQDLRLLRIRNPWGRRCWGGAWGHSGEGWSQLELDCAKDLLSRTEEGEFWVEEQEFLREFDEVTVAYPISEKGFLQSIHTGRELPHTQQVSGSWVKGHSAGGCRNHISFGSNPKYWLRVSEAGELLLSLSQRRRETPPAPGFRGKLDGRSSDSRTPDPSGESGEDGQPSGRHRHYQAIGLHLWKVEKRRFNLARTLNKPPCASTDCHSYDREVTLHAHLSPGFYLLIPSTFLQDAEARFLLRVFSSGPLSLSTVKAPPSSAVALEISLSKGEWEASSSEGRWVPGATAGGSRNFPSHVSNPCIPFAVSLEPNGANVRITLRQHCPARDCQPIGFHVYQVPGGSRGPPISPDQEPQASCVPHCYTQEVSLALSLAPGSYAVVPSTYEPDCPGRFTVTVALKVDRKAVKSKENLGRIVQEVSHISVMRS